MVEAASAKFLVVVDETKVSIVAWLSFSLQELSIVVNLKSEKKGICKFYCAICHAKMAQAIF